MHSWCVESEKWVEICFHHWTSEITQKWHIWKKWGWKVHRWKVCGWSLGLKSPGWNVLQPSTSALILPMHASRHFKRTLNSEIGDTFWKFVVVFIYFFSDLKVISSFFLIWFWKVKRKQRFHFQHEFQHATAYGNNMINAQVK